VSVTIRAVIFDLDGTLLDSIADIGGAMNDTLSARGWPTHPIDRYFHLVGDGVEILARRAVPEGKYVPELVDEYRANYSARIELHTRPYEGIPELLDALHAKGVKLAVLSNKRHDFTVELVKRQLKQWPFTAVAGERAGIPRKPHPAPALELARVLEVEPKDIAFVGDTPIDVQTAVAAGMLPVAVLWGFRPKAELTEAGAHHTLSHPRELLGLL
jgi:phosphoglycolate phosphatase